MKVCNENQIQIHLYIDGELPEDEARALEAHMAQCPACRRYCEEMRMVSRAVGDMEPPAGLHDAIMQAVSEAQASEKVVPFAKPAGRAGKHQRKRRWLPTVAAMLAIAVVGVFGMTHGVSTAYKSARAEDSAAGVQTTLFSDAAMDETAQPASTESMTTDSTAEAEQKSTQSQSPMRLQTPMLGWFGDNADHVEVVSGDADPNQAGGAAQLSDEQVSAIAEKLAGQADGGGFYLVAAGRPEDLPAIFADQAGDAQAGDTLVISVRNDPEVRQEIADNMRQCGFVLYDGAAEDYFPVDEAAAEGLLIVELTEE